MRAEDLVRPLGLMDRRDFLKLGGAGLAVIALLGTTGSHSVLAQEGSSLVEEFEEAAEKYRVPKELLLAIGYVNTHWEMPSPQASDHEEGELDGKGTYGIMALVRNPSADTLGEASQLTDRRSNIFGGAALLARSQGERPTALGDYLGAVDGEGGNGKVFEAVAGIGGGELYADQVFETLKNGASARTKSGEQISLPPQSLTSRVTSQGEVL
jgi:hypothetical protein